MRGGVLLAPRARSQYGGLPVPRPDQVIPASSAGVAPGSATGPVRARQVIIFGTGASTGLFVYNGTPAKGNPPQVAIVNSSATQDPYGNAITTAAILIQANIITETGGVFRTSAAAPLIQLDGPHNAVLIYDSARLRETIAPVVTNDGLGSVVQAGFTAYGAVATAFAQLTQAALNFQATGDVTQSQVFGGGGALVLNSGAATSGPAVAAMNLLQSLSAAGAPRAVFGSNSSDAAVLQFAQGAGTPLTSDLNGAPSLTWLPSSLLLSEIDPTDGNAYTLAKKTIFATGASQLVNSAANAAITGLTINVSARTYRYHAKIVWTQGGTASNQKFGITGPATSSALFSMTTVNTSSVTTIDGRTSNSLVTVAEAQGGTGFVAITDIDGWATFTASGTLSVAVACSVAANTFTVNNPFCFLDLTPIT